ncbi:6-carboxytetrahydropterin synthase [Endozoicomonas sp. SCSIO W0465]|uniref:6-pyruvoyl trahydropterin synthase family protein n=1 Tax=Endozoicomonas sp. SCSIO W0465 TaxID=2918516 RepID=UPI002075F221|nr:6-carboxytetrahydropterin synthase [Endozoicomonas sp. SCSIO W0465]USE37465.1 6-carboxytetrahydropterin synthase [Endozoicomonas sp. SCSIO W0465]
MGETWLVDVMLGGELDEQGMVFDFGHVKKQVKASLDNLSDHRLLVPLNTAEASVTHNIIHNKEQLVVSFTTLHGMITCSAPAQAVLLVDAEAITPELLTPFLEKAIQQVLPDNVTTVEFRLYPEEIGGAYYHYSHGLKKHDGDCQRIAHGHRSQIRVFVDELRDQALEARWASQWRDIYIATKEDLLGSYTRDNVEYYRFGYTANQGYFEISLPSTDCYLIDTDTTVELLARHIALCLSEQNPGKTIRVVAFEGLNKGAIAMHSEPSAG